MAFDDNGGPTKAAQGFARSQGVEPSDLRVLEFDGKAYATVRRVRAGRPTAEVLSEQLPRLIGSIRFPLAMRWNATGEVFSRPIRWYVALLDDQVVPFEQAGAASGRTTRGIRPEGSPRLVLGAATEYLPAMEANGVMLDAGQRLETIRQDTQRLGTEVDAKVADDLELLAEVSNLVEWPAAIRGEFGREYLALPRQVLIAVMKKHQRYFALEHDGSLLPYFVAVANGRDLDVDAVRGGNEEVLRARYADAEFFYAADSRSGLEAFLPRLATLTFHEKLGSMLDKANRLEELVPLLGALFGLPEEEIKTAQRAAHLCKADLATQMVVEHTSLQGEMGGHYALLQGESEAVSQAIGEHYRPRWAGDAVPGSLAGVAVGLADRLDSLLGLFSVGSVPSGSADPYGLRRAAYGVLQILIDRKLGVSLRAGLQATSDLLPIPVEDGVVDEVLKFLRGRLRGLLLTAGYRYDLVDAVLAERADDPFGASLAVQMMSRWVSREDWMDLLNGYARCVRITREYEQSFALDPGLLVEPAAASLYRAYLHAKESVEPKGDINSMLEAVRSLIPTIVVFFDEVLVMAENRDLRENRLALLQRISDLPAGIVDLRRVEGF